MSSPQHPKRSFLNKFSNRIKSTGKKIGLSGRDSRLPETEANTATEVRQGAESGRSSQATSEPTLVAGPVPPCGSARLTTASDTENDVGRGVESQITTSEPSATGPIAANISMEPTSPTSEVRRGVDSGTSLIPTTELTAAAPVPFSCSTGSMDDRPHIRESMIVPERVSAHAPAFPAFDSPSSQDHQRQLSVGLDPELLQSRPHPMSFQGGMNVDWSEVSIGEFSCSTIRQTRRAKQSHVLLCSCPA